MLLHTRELKLTIDIFVLASFDLKYLVLRNQWIYPVFRFFQAV